MRGGGHPARAQVVAQPPLNPPPHNPLSQLSAHDVHSFFHCFCMIDKDSSGSIDLDEFFDYMDLDYSRFAVRAFDSMDVHRGVDSSAHVLHFQEFLVGIFNYCTLTHDTLVKFAFDILDKEGTGLLTTAHVRELVDMIYGARVDAQVQRLLQRLDRDHNNQIDIKEFRAIEKRARMMLFPIFMLQHQIQSKLMSTRWWEKATDKRMRALGNEDLIEWHFAHSTGRKLHRATERGALCHCVVHDEEGAVVRDKAAPTANVLTILPRGTNVKVFEQRYGEAAAASGGGNAAAVEVGEGVGAGTSWIRIHHVESEWIDAHACEVIDAEEETGIVRKESLDDVVTLERTAAEEQEREVAERNEARRERERRAAEAERRKQWLKCSDGDGREFWIDAEVSEVLTDRPHAPFTPL